MATWIVGAAVALIVAAILRKLFRDKKAGRSACGGDCARCHGGCAYRER